MRICITASAIVLIAASAAAQRFIMPPEPLTPVAQWFHTDDYPPAAMRGQQEGDVSVLLSIDPQGMVAGCEVTQTSGYPLLDKATCALATRRGRFRPARDRDRQPTSGSYVISNLKWRIGAIGAPTFGPPIVAVSPPGRG